MSATYLLSSLPMLELGVEAPFPVEELRRRCEGVDGVSLNDFDAVVAGIPGSHQFTVDYANALIEIRNATAAFRASKWESSDVRVVERSHAGCHVDLRQKLADAMSVQNPFEREFALEKARWQIADELAGINYFSEAKIYAYIVKLQINNRFVHLNNEAGKAAVEEFIKANDRGVKEG
ncbi:MAG: DUF2764 domain-containing protein [Fibromonadaceae bacterium]|jgi:hypothetical protein|nr:DUF2764 domain-containing protein [Fibromonadaceae bacterium]